MAQRTLALAGLVVLLLLIDLSLPRVNVAIIYAIPLVVAAGWMRPAGVLALSSLLILMTYGVFLAKYNIEQRAELGAELAYRLTNRTLAAVSIIAITFILLVHQRYRDQMNIRRSQRVTRDVDAELYREISEAVEQLVAGIVCGLLVACIAISDLALPGQFNVPILYGISIYLCVLARSRRLLWMLTPILLLLTGLGFFLGKPPTVPESLAVSLLTNRLLAALGLLGLAVAADLWIRFGSPSWRARVQQPAQ